MNIQYQSFFPEGNSVLIGSIRQKLTLEQKNKILEEELRWHYSQHYFSEMNGEEVIQDMIQIAPSVKAQTLLKSQLRDELEHCKIFGEIKNRIGFDSRAHYYASSYMNLVKKQKSISEKVFVFQVLTEAVSFAYCYWRRKNIHDVQLNVADDEVYQDELRHLKMAKTVLKFCDREEVNKVLTAERRKQLVREMNQICKHAMKTEMYENITPRDIEGDPSQSLNSLDYIVSKSIVGEARSCASVIEELNAR